MIFNSRDTYLAAVSSWKEQYKELSINIRKTKVEFKNSQKQDSLDNINRSSTYNIGCNLINLKNEANELLAERAAGKKEAQVQYLANRVQV